MNHILYIGNNLKQPNSNVSVMSTFGPLLEIEGYKVHYASSKRNKVVRLIDMIYHVFRYASIVDIVFIDTYSTQNFYFAWVVSQLCRILRLPYIPFLHGGNLPNRLIQNPKMSALIFKNSYINVVPSNYLKAQFEKYGYTNITYIPNSIEIGNYPFFDRPFTEAKLLWVRSFSKIYNPSMAIHVLKNLRDRGMDATLCMVGPDGDGSLQDVKDLATHLGVDVKFTGKLSKSEWIQLSSHYNVFINTTTIDNTPVSVIEAMALGLPVISTNVGGMSYLIESGVHGILLNEPSVEAMSDAVIALLQNTEERQDIILNARGRAESFDWNTIRHKWHDLLKI